MSTVDYLFGVITQPLSVFQAVAREKPVKEALLVYFGASFLNLLSSGGSGEFAVVPGWLVVTGGLFFSLVVLVLFTRAVHFIASIFSRQGDYRGLLSVFGFAHFPAFFLPPAFLVSNLLGQANGIIYVFFSFAAAAWIFYLVILGLRENYRLKTALSVVVVLLTLLLLALLVFSPFILLLVIFRLFPF